MQRVLIRKTALVTLAPDADQLLERFWRAHPDLRAEEAADHGADPVADPQRFWPVELAEPEHADVCAQIAHDGAFTMQAARRWITEEQRDDDVEKAAPTPGVLYLIRHGKTRLNGTNDDDRIRGWRDIPLDHTGEQQAARLGQLFHGAHVDAVYSSDLTRAKQTAKPIAAAVGKPVRAPRDFRPWHLGRFQGASSKQVTEALHEYTNDPDKRVPGGESFNAFLGRYLPALEKLLAQVKAGQEIVLVAHYRNAKAAQAYLDGDTAGTEAADLDVGDFLHDGVDTGSIMAIRWNPDQQRFVWQHVDQIRKDSPTVSQVHSDAPLGSDRTARQRKPRLDEDELEPRDVQLVKADQEQRLIYGIVLEPHVTDSQDDWESPDDIEKAAHRYLQKGWQSGDAWNTLQHRARLSKGALVPVESFIAPCDFVYPESPDDLIRKGSWVLVAKVASDVLWDEVKKGTFSGWSVGGSGRRVDEPLPA